MQCVPRGEPLDIIKIRSKKDLFSDLDSSWCEWLYVWQDGQWYCMSVYDHDSGALRPLNVEAEEEALAHGRKIVS